MKLNFVRKDRSNLAVPAALLTVATLMGLSQPASAQQAIDIQNFRPALGPNAIYSVEGADTLDHMMPAAAVMLNYASQPLLMSVTQNGRTRSVPVVDQQLNLNLMMGLGLFDWLQLDLAIPLYPVNDGDTTELFGTPDGREFGGMRAGDLALRLKGTLLSSQAPGKRFGLALGLEGRLPTGSPETFVGDPNPTLTPKLIADLNLGSVFIAANVGSTLRSAQELQNVSFGTELNYGLGVQWSIMQDLVALGAEVFGKTQLAGQDDGAIDFQGSPLEFLLGVKLHTPSGFSVTTGAGSAILDGYGAPEFRAIIGVSYVDKPQQEQIEAPKDTDNDGLADDRDACPDQPEDMDGFQDEDGCPEDDNDGDNIPDAQDKCPDQAEDMDGFQDEDGCPDDDNDGDGVSDVDDKCPNKAGVAEHQGCEPPVLLKAIPKRTFNKLVLKVNKIELLEKVFFETNKATILPESFGLLDEVAGLLEQYPQIKLVEIAGHTDSVGKAAANKTLSQERADAVLKYLVDKGIAAERLKAIGHGQEKPLVSPEKTDEDRAKNRRVEFNILEQDPITEQRLETAPKPSAPTTEQ